MDVTKKDLIEIFDEFLNEFGLWTRFEDWLASTQNLEPSDIGFTEED